jgi:hypothetical protein
MDQLIDNNKVCFIIAHKYFRGYPSYLKLYTERIFNHYPNALVIVVDNNSVYKDDIFSTLNPALNIVLLDNNIESKFELGAYQVGLSHLIDKGLTGDYRYIALTQDNFILNKRLDYNILVRDNVKACTINSYYQDEACNDVCDPILNSLGMNDNKDKITFCWCSSFIIANENIHKLYDILKTIVQKVRWDSCGAERYLARILWELNNFTNYDLDGDIRELAKVKYDCWTVDPYSDTINSYFIKRVQQKTEKTVDR